jgi:hypothetical protein
MGGNTEAAQVPEGMSPEDADEMAQVIWAGTGHVLGPDGEAAP